MNKKTTSNCYHNVLWIPPSASINTWNITHLRNKNVAWCFNIYCEYILWHLSGCIISRTCMWEYGALLTFSGVPTLTNCLSIVKHGICVFAFRTFFLFCSRYTTCNHAFITAPAEPLLEILAEALKDKVCHV